MTEIPFGGPRIRRSTHEVRPFLVRGEAGDPAIDEMQCRDFLRRYPAWGRYGLSSYEAADAGEIDRLASDQLERFPTLSIFRSSILEQAGFDVVPTFRSPHVTIAFTGDVDDRLQALAALRDEVRTNPYHG